MIEAVCVGAIEFQIAIMGATVTRAELAASRLLAHSVGVVAPTRDACRILSYSRRVDYLCIVFVPDAMPSSRLKPVQI